VVSSGSGRGRAGPIVIRFLEVLTIQDGKVRKIEFFRHRAAALEAAERREQAPAGGRPGLA
jgi:hypothetical protein